MNISKHRLDKLIPVAFELLQTSEMVERIGQVEVIGRTYHGYISSFGAMMAISSPLAAALMFENGTANGETRTKEDRRLIPGELLKLLRKEGETVVPPNLNALSEFLISKMHGNGLPRATKMDLAAACVALKIAMRSFPKK